MKKLLMTLMASMLLLSQATYASQAVNHNTHMVHKTSFSKKDAQALFGTNKVKATALDNGEMAKTEGEWLPNLFGAIIGGSSAGWGYLGGTAAAGHAFSWSSFGAAALGGAALGAINPISSAGAAAANFGVGTVAGFGGGFF